MKKLMFVMMVTATISAFADEAAVPEVPAKPAVSARTELAAKSLGVTVDEYNKMTPEARKARRDELRAKRLGVTVEEYNKMTPEQQKAKRIEKEGEIAAKQAKRLGVTVEEYNKMTPAERKEKLASKKAKKPVAK